MKRVELVGLEGIAEVHAGDSVGQLICDACERQQFALADGDVLVVAQKIVSKAEGQMIALATVRPSARAQELARELGKEPELIEVILGESRRVIRTGGRALIVETHHGFVCANAGVDQSNVGLKQVALLPKDADRSAREIRAEIRRRTGKNVGVIVSDSFGRAWRVGTVDVAVGVAGINPIKDERGLKDRHGYELKAAVAAVADEIGVGRRVGYGQARRCARRHRSRLRYSNQGGRIGAGALAPRGGRSFSLG